MMPPPATWQVTTYLAGRRSSGIAVPLFLDGPMTGSTFHAQVQQFLAPPLAPDEVWRRRVLLHASFAGSGPGGPGGGQVFAKLKTLRRQAAVRSRETVWNTIGRLLDAFSPAE
ncbi:hypothetical protein [Geminicoccus roseus]|uniref:hypothetical protein n=1 Tax=Geminicoccus roseus TaxID=404900 RepID=UPI000420CE49